MKKKKKVGIVGLNQGERLVAERFNSLKSNMVVSGGAEFKNIDRTHGVHGVTFIYNTKMFSSAHQAQKKHNASLFIWILVKGFGIKPPKMFL